MKKTVNINLTGNVIFKVFDVAERTVKSMAHITGYTLLFLLSAGAIGFLVRKPIKNLVLKKIQTTQKIHLLAQNKHLNI